MNQNQVDRLVYVSIIGLCCMVILAMMQGCAKRADAQPEGPKSIAVDTGIKTTNGYPIFRYDLTDAICYQTGYYGTSYGFSCIPKKVECE